MARTELVLCRGWRGVSAFACRTLQKIRERNRDPLALNRALVLVPTAAAGHLLRQQLEDALLTRRSAAVIPRVATPAELVEEQTPRLADPLLREALMERAFQRARAAGASPPFAVRSGLARRVLDFYDTLRLRSSEKGFFTRALEELEAPDDEGAVKLGAQTRFLEASIEDYRRSLDDLDLVDPPEARSLLREASFPFEEILVLGSETLEPLDLDSLAGGTGVEALTLAVSESSTELPDWLVRSFGAVRTFEEERPAPPRVLSPEKDLTFVARDREEALTDVARLLKLLEDDSRLAPLHRVAVVVPRPLPYLYVAKKVFTEAGVPHQLQDSFPLATEPYIAAVDVVLELVAARAHRSAALALLRNPFFSFPGVGALEVAAFDELTLRYREPGGVERWRSLHERLARPPLQPALPGIEAREAESRVLPALAALVAASDELSPLAGPGPLTEKIDCLRRFLEARGADPERRHPDEPSRPHRARKAFEDILARLEDAARRVDDPPVDFPAFREKLRRAIECHTFALRTGAAGVQIVDARSAPFGSFDLVVLLGLNEGEWPARSERNIFYPQWLLRDFGWPSDRDLLASERRRFTGLLDLAGKHVALFRHQIEDEIPTVASPFLDDARTWMKERSAEAAPVPSALADVVVTRADAFRRGLLRGPTTPRKAGLVDGPLAVPEPVSPTAIELYLRCPFKYFSRYLLDLEEEDEVDESLTPLERGRILHEILQEAFAEWDRGRETPRRIEPESYEEALALFRRVALTKIPPEHRSVEIARLFGGAGEPGAIPWLLRREMSRGPTKERLVEHPFASPLRLERGPRGESPWYVRIKGRVDRADVDGDGCLHVFDYKSGRAPSDAIALQVPLYAMCLSQELQAPVREATYLSFHDRKATSRADFEKASHLLVEAYGAIQGGRFGPRPFQEHLCASCGFVGVCRKEIEEVPT